MWSAFWPILVIAVGVASLVVVPRAWLGPLLVTALGVYWLLGALDIVHASAWTYALPIAIIVVGLSILVASTASSTNDDRITGLVFLWGANRRSASQTFRSASLTSILGGINVDLRTANIVGKARVDAFTFFGGVDLKVPPTWQVSVTGLPIFGGWTDKTNPPADPGAPVLDVHVVSIFGGVTVKQGGFVVMPTVPAA